MQRTLRNSLVQVARSSCRAALALCVCACIGACSSSPESQWKGDDGGYGGTGRFNPTGADAGSDSQYNSVGTHKN
ncbi:MAG: hypothetical protein ACREJD_15545 [Phycisphaerales bacterium]